MDLITVKKLKFSYPAKKDTLKGISFNVEEGKFVCMVGENGSGKSTTMKCILGLNKGYEGTIELKDRVRVFTTKNRNTKQFSSISTRSSYVWNYTKQCKKYFL